jgi:hypothetical protein
MCIGKTDALPGKFIDIRCMGPGVWIAIRYIPIAHVIGQYDNYVGLLRYLAVGDYQRRSKYANQERNDVLVHGGSDINGNANY